MPFLHGAISAAGRYQASTDSNVVAMRAVEVLCCFFGPCHVSLHVLCFSYCRTRRGVSELLLPVSDPLGRLLLDHPTPDLGSLSSGFCSPAPSESQVGVAIFVRKIHESDARPEEDGPTTAGAVDTGFNSFLFTLPDC